MGLRGVIQVSGLTKSPSPTRRIFGLLIAFFFAASLLPIIAAIDVPASAQLPKFDVEFEIDDRYMTYKILYIAVRNLQDSPDDINLKTILYDTNFSIFDVAGAEFAISKKEEYQENVPDYDNVPREVPIYDNENNIIGYENEWHWGVVGWHLENGERWIWKSMPLVSKTEDGLKGELRHQWEEISIAKAGAPYGTLRFKLKFRHPVVQRAGGWGSRGVVALDLNGENFVDLAGSSWWDTNWAYRAPMTLTVHPDNYQIGFVLDKVDNLNSHCLDNFQDLRFVENENESELNFWIENYISGDNATIWIRRVENDVPGDNEIYIYYGNASSKSAENGENTFIFFDDFNDNSFDASKWNLVGSDTYQEQNERFEVSDDDASYDTALLTQDTFSRSFVLEYDFKLNVNNTFFGIHDSGVGASYTNFVYGVHHDIASQVVYEDGNGRDAQGTRSTNWREYRFSVKSTGCDYYNSEDGTFYESSYSSEGSLKIGFTSSVSGASYYVDDVRIRKFVSPEPTVSLGTEELAPAWNLIETWTGTIDAPAIWWLTETWTGAVQAPAEWQLIEAWSGTVEAPAAWTLIETWSGTVSTPVTNTAPTCEITTADGYDAYTNEGIAFTCTASDPDGDVITYSWGFGDGGNSALQNPSYQYSSSGDYRVTLTVSDGTLTGSASIVVNIYNPSDPGGPGWVPPGEEPPEGPPPEPEDEAPPPPTIPLPIAGVWAVLLGVCFIYLSSLPAGPQKRRWGRDLSKWVIPTFALLTFLYIRIEGIIITPVMAVIGVWVVIFAVVAFYFSSIPPGPRRQKWVKQWLKWIVPTLVILTMLYIRIMGV